MTHKLTSHVRTTSSRSKKPPRPKPTLVVKEVHGRACRVKVYPPAVAEGADLSALTAKPSARKTPRAVTLEDL